MTDLAREDIIRDKLYLNISTLASDLEVLEKEKYIPSDIGTRSFIDILAKDKDNKLVCIELKRSNAASRQAIHEILKYSETLKRHLSINEREMRFIIVSTEWKELLLPFSRLVFETSLSVCGLHIAVDSNGNVISVEAVTPLSIQSGRIIAPWHEVGLYKDHNSLLKGIQTHEHSCKRKNIANYVLVILKASDEFNKIAQNSFEFFYKDLLSSIREYGDEELVDVPVLEKFDYMIYFCVQGMDIEACLSLIDALGDDAEKEEASLVELDEEDALYTLHSQVMDLNPRPFREHFEIGYAAKFMKVLDQEKWRILDIKRYGSFARNFLLDNDVIIDELRGNDGFHPQKFKRSIRVDNRSDLVSVKDAINTCLQNNPTWLVDVNQCLDEIVDAIPNAVANVDIYNPSSGLATLFMAATNANGTDYVPRHFMSANAGDEILRVYYGCLIENGNVPCLGEVLDEFYHGEMLRFLMTLSWGGYEDRDTRIMQMLGLSYRSFQQVMERDQLRHFVLHERRWIECDYVDPLTSVFSFLNKWQEFTEILVTKISSHWNGSFYFIDNAKDDTT